MIGLAVSVLSGEGMRGGDSGRTGGATAAKGSKPASDFFLVLPSLFLSRHLQEKPDIENQLILQESTYKIMIVWDLAQSIEFEAECPTPWQTPLIFGDYNTEVGY